MTTFIMTGKYSTEAIKQISGERTTKGIEIVQKCGGKLVAGYATMENYGSHTDETVGRRKKREPRLGRFAMEMVAKKLVAYSWSLVMIPGGWLMVEEISYQRLLYSIVLWLRLQL